MAAWSYVRTAFGYFVNLVIGTATIKHIAGDAVMAFCFNKSTRSPLGLRVFGGVNSYVHPRRWTETICYESMSSQPFLVRYNKQFALVGLMDFSKDNPNIGNHDSSNSISVRYIRGCFNLEAFINDAVDYYNHHNRQNNGEPKISRFRVIRFMARGEHGGSGDAVEEAPSLSTQPTRKSETDEIINKMLLSGVYRLLRWKTEDLQMQPEEGQTPFTGYPFPETVTRNLTEVERWLKSEKWFRSKSIPWRLGWLLYGPPGTGKSTLVRAMGMHFNMPVFMFDMAGMTNCDFTRRWDQTLGNTPCIVLIEDIDNVFNGRQYVGGQSPTRDHITFDCLLNCISGVKQADGVFLIITTNRIETIDAALGMPNKETGRSTRPGRIDRAVYLGQMEEPERGKLARHILSDYPGLVDDTVQAGNGETAAQFQARCAELALSKFWDKTP